jgi:K+-sensing histidine kinase KdpD
MARMTKAQARKRIKEAVAKLSKVYDARWTAVWINTPSLEKDLREAMTKLSKQAEKLK